VHWSVTDNEGMTFQAGVLKPVDCAPGKTVKVKIPFELGRSLKPDSEFWLRLSLHTRTDALWAKAGHEIAWQQMALDVKSPANRKAKSNLPPLKLVGSGDTATIAGINFSATFSRAAGTLSSLKYNGRELLAQDTNGPAGPQLQIFRAQTDNDKGFGHWLGRDWREAGLSNVTHHVESLAITNLKSGEFRLYISTTNITIVTTTNSATNNLARAARSAGTKSVTTSAGTTNAVTGIVTNTVTNLVYRLKTIWTIHKDGSLEMENEFSPLSKKLPPLPRVGIVMRLAKDFENVRWLGRGPWENYSDRKESADMGLWKSTVAAQYVPYVRPQENGNKEDVRWLKLTDPTGNGLNISAVENPFSFSALHFTQLDLATTRHNYELKPREEIILSLDAKNSGLGNGSCGPGVLEKYAVLPTNYTLKLRFKPLPCE
jgi:beta-galactosidase